MKTLEEKQYLVQSRSWYHSIEIEAGLVTPGWLSQAHLQQVLKYLQFPDSFEGLTVLDIGAWDGFFSFEAERRGAKRVVALDVDPPDTHGFAIAKELLDSRVEFVRGNVYDLSAEVHGNFDIVFFFGVFYHLRYPLLALDRIRQVVTKYLLMETNCMDNHLVLANQEAVPLTAIDPRLVDIPLYRFYRHDELNPGDFSNWFSPNRRAVEDALWSAGFRPEFLAAWGDRIVYKATRLESIPEYLLQTYEGRQWIRASDGTFSLQVCLCDQDNADTLSPLPTFVGPPVLLPDARELQTTAEQEVRRLLPQVNQLHREIAGLRGQISTLQSRITFLQDLITLLRRGRVYRFLRFFGMWKWLEKNITED
ncbi:MAG: DUF1698 domain-containing protein [Chloroflexi bacterium]|nr:DUF1698 domain-containing protein [Chloroflexota bacterium]